jgi:asparagine synthetase B (glutamine-hydrolysing)
MMAYVLRQQEAFKLWSREGLKGVWYLPFVRDLVVVVVTVEKKEALVMCGILLDVSIVAEEDHPGRMLPAATNMFRRGPDHAGSVVEHYDTQERTILRVELQASVLTMRSPSSSPRQPVSLSLPSCTTTTTQEEEEASRTMHLAWNGEVYQRLSSTSTTINHNNDETTLETVAGYDISDTQIVADMLLQAHAECLLQAQQQQQQHGNNNKHKNDNESIMMTTGGIRMNDFAKFVAAFLGRLVNAEYAFCIVTPWAIYYGRDPWGRRSLLYYHDANEKASTTNHHQQQQTTTTTTTPTPCWKLCSVIEEEANNSTAFLSGSNNATTTTSTPCWKEVVPGILHEYRFDGGTYHTTPIQHPPFAIPPTIISSSSSFPTIAPLTSDVFGPVTRSMWTASLGLEHWLREAVRLRVSCGSDTMTTPTAASSCWQNNHSHAATTTSTSSPPTVAVLFSGGIDSVVLAALTLQVVPTTTPLRLWNVSFVSEKHCCSTNNDNKDPVLLSSSSTAQDCRAALASYHELVQLFPNHSILLETTEVSWDEMTEYEEHIRTLIHPKTTLMDLNIGMALWFASRGRKRGLGKEEEEEKEKEPTILLVGMGADEQLGGYGRHRKAFQRAPQKEGDMSLSEAALREELDLDMDRLWERNLGRDDRIFSDHGKEARFPYLDFCVMTFLRQTPLEDICDYGLPPGTGDKRILRLLAMRLGLRTASGMVKRAIQFGSRIAHVSDKKRFGSRRKAQGTAVA